MRCDFCGTKVKVVGDTTKHYEPVVDRSEIASIAFEEIWGEFNATSGRLTTDKTDKMCVTMSQNIADRIISAMYGGEK